MKRDLWTMRDWEKWYGTANIRRGLRLRCDEDIEPEVRRACKEFCSWIRENYEFPMRVPIYLKNAMKIKAIDGELVSATFFRTI